MGEGENRQVTLNHRIQLRRFSNDVTKILRNQSNRSILLSQLPSLLSQIQQRPFNVTEYGVCNIEDLLNGLKSSEIEISPVNNGNDILISKPVKRFISCELRKLSVFAEEVNKTYKKDEN